MEGGCLPGELQIYRLSDDPDPGNGMAGDRQSNLSCSPELSDSGRYQSAEYLVLELIGHTHNIYLSYVISNQQINCSINKVLKIFNIFT